MSKVLIDRELLERAVYGLELAYETDTPAVRDICAVLSAPSGTPEMPVKAYYHESGNLDGIRTRSVGLEVRKEFTDAPLVLEADALGRIACLEGEIAKRDARIVELDKKYGWALSELSALKAQEPIGWYTEDHLDDKSATTYSWTVAERWVEKGWPVSPLYAAPVSEAKAQGVVQWPNADEIMQMAFEEGQPADDASGYCFELEEFDLFIERLMSEVARLNAAPAQQVVPDGSTKMQWPEIVALVNEVLGCEAHKYPCERGSIGHEMTGINFNSLARVIDRVRYAAAPAAPAADAGLVEALDWLDDFVARCNGDDRGSCDSVNIIRAALAAHRSTGVV